MNFSATTIITIIVFKFTTREYCKNYRDTKQYRSLVIYTSCIFDYNSQNSTNNKVQTEAQIHVSV